ncbi:hypothetical protein P875_00034101 [Aspergillus parasiticus SU-1]|uniref:Secreted protein n=1 Tax=Aspergillus parasiticus (strain ATCC 56775 / NRRL 5862 / SRRC 143 / SU-1) TaxID=1403190 RepID=A0A0F0I5J9_ASPPU|nr:hypothetical protein P875_00034101 [Aspergillus parasiticus SU-1]
MSFNHMVIHVILLVGHASVVQETQKQRQRRCSNRHGSEIHDTAAYNTFLSQTDKLCSSLLTRQHRNRGRTIAIEN